MMYCFIIMSVILRKSWIFIFKKSFSDLFGGSLSLCQKLADFSRKGQDNILDFVSNTVCCSDSIFQRESSDRLYPNKWVWPCSNNGSYIKPVSGQFALLAAVCQSQPLPYAVFFFLLLIGILQAVFCREWSYFKWSTVPFHRILLGTRLSSSGELQLPLFSARELAS